MKFCHSFPFVTFVVLTVDQFDRSIPPFCCLAIAESSKIERLILKKDFLSLFLGNDF